MKAYLVGGAVRDRLLGIPVVEQDWVVVGATPQDMLKQNYRQVGRSFPVFLHPTSQEEYALARIERKHGRGYYGFACSFDASVRLEEDLARRDLTINAIAQDETGRLIDPFNGQRDLKQRILRHVSPAFVEDPVRVLRLARFMARFYHLGFTIAKETYSLMYSMVQSKELEHLIAERIWQEWQRSLTEKNPEQFILTLRRCGALNNILPELDALFGIPKLRSVYFESDSGMYALSAFKKAIQCSDDPAVRFAVLLHNLGDGCVSMNNWPIHSDYAEQSATVIKQLGMRLRIPKDYVLLAKKTASSHHLLKNIRKLPAHIIVSTLETHDAFRRPELFTKLLIACQAISSTNTLPQLSMLWLSLLTECNKITADDIIHAGYRGVAIKEKIHQQRIMRVNALLNQWKAHEK